MKHIPRGMAHPIADMQARNWDIYSTDSPPPREQPADILARVQTCYPLLFCAVIPASEVVAVTYGDVVAFVLGVRRTGWAIEQRH